MTDIKALKDQVIAEIEQHKEELIQLCSRLIQYPSVNPPGNSEPISQYIEAFLKQYGVTTQWYEAAPNMWNLVSSIGASSGRTLILCGHTDVVSAGDLNRWEHDPFAGVVTDGWIHGRGASDMKCGLAGLIFASAILRKLHIELPGQIKLVIVPDEETGGMYGVPWMLERGLVEGDGCIIAEPAFPYHPTIGQKGCSRVRFIFHGVPAHSALAPLAGKSAIMQALKAIEKITQTMTIFPNNIDSQLLRDSKSFLQGAGFKNESEILDQVAFNIGTIQGGISVNVVPDHCGFELDFRIPYGLTRDKILQAIQTELDMLELDYRIELFGIQSDPNCTSSEDPVCRSVTNAITYVSGEKSFGVLQWAASDARHFRAFGIPVLQYGPAYLPSIHSYNEKAPVEDVIRCAKVYAAAAIDFLYG